MKTSLFFVLFAFLYVSCLPAQEKLACRAALVQAHLVWGEVTGNLLAFEQRVKQCRGCDLIIFPELFTSGCEMQKRDKATAADKKDSIASRYPEVLATMKHWAALSGALVMGSTIYKEEGRYYNRLLAVFPDGAHQYYDKHNCFKKGSYSPGDKQLLIEWKGRRFATYICYDLRFPEWSRNNSSYDTAIYIANWPESRRDDWQRLLKERAIENRASILAVNCAGTDPAGLTYAGDTAYLSSEGEVLGQCCKYVDDILIVDL